MFYQNISKVLQYLLGLCEALVTNSIQRRFGPKKSESNPKPPNQFGKGLEVWIGWGEGGTAGQL